MLSKVFDIKGRNEMKIITIILLGINILSAAITCQMVNVNSQQNMLIHRDVVRNLEEIEIAKNYLNTVNENLMKFERNLDKDMEVVISNEKIIMDNFNKNIDVVISNQRIITDNQKLNEKKCVERHEATYDWINQVFRRVQ